MNTSHRLPSQTLFVLALPSRVSWCMFHCSMAKRGSIVLILVLSPFLESIFLVYPTQFLAKYSKNDLQIFFGAFIFLATLRMYMKPVKITKYSMNMQNIKHTWHHDYEQRADCIMDMLRQHRWHHETHVSTKLVVIICPRTPPVTQLFDTPLLPFCLPIGWCYSRG